MTDVRYDFAPNPGAQTEFLTCQARYPGLFMGFGGGKTWAGSVWLCMDHCNFPGSNSLAIAPTYGSLRQFTVPALMERLSEIGVNGRLNSTTMEIHTPELGSRILLHSGLNAERIAGFEVGRTWIDEPARIPDYTEPQRNVWYNAVGRTRIPRVPEHRRRVCVTGTHEGVGTWVYRKWIKERKAGYAAFRGRTDENPLNEDYARTLEAEYGPELAEQYVQGGAVADTLSVIDYESLLACQSSEASMEHVDTLGHLSGDLYWGVDIGRSKSLTVAWGAERVGDILVTRAVMTMREATFAEQADMITSLCRHPNTVGVAIDATYNPQTAEDAALEYPLVVDPVQFTTAVKIELVEGIVRRLQSQTLLLPAGHEAEDILLDFYSVKRIVSPAGRVTYTAPYRPDGHADRFFAAALACRAAGWDTIPRTFSRAVTPARRTVGIRGL